MQQLRSAPCTEIVASPEERHGYLLRDYAYLGDDPALLCERLGLLVEMHGHEVIARWQAWAREGQLAPLFDELMRLHYDPHYGRSQARNFRQWDRRTQVPAPDLSEAGIAALASQILRSQAAAA